MKSTAPAGRAEPHRLGMLAARIRSGAKRRLLAAPDAHRYRLLVHSLFSSPTSMILSNVVGVAIPFFCWEASGLHDFLTLFVAASVIVACRIVLALHYRRVSRGPLSDRAIERLDQLFFAGSTSFSIVLGSACYVALAETDSIPCHIITIVCAIAYSAGYVARNSGRPLFVVLQILCFCVPMCAGLLQASEPLYSAIALFIAFFVITNIAIVFSLNRNLVALAIEQRKTDDLTTSLTAKNETLDSALNTMTHGLVMFGPTLELEVANSRFAELYRLDAADVLPGTGLIALLERLIATGRLASDAALRLGLACRQALDGKASGPVEIVTAHREVFAVHAERTGGGGVLFVTEDATERRAAAAQIERLAHTDVLTGLPNRLRFTEILRSVCEAAAAGQSGAAVLSVDLDNFKSVNDTLGHDSGDRFLAQVASRLRSVLNQGEIVARVGGDEFVLLTPASDRASALATGRRLIATMAEPFTLVGHTLPVTASVGIALVPEHGTEPGEVLRAADMALYAAKRGGRNAVSMFEHGIAETVRSQRELEFDLREACRDGELFLHYQPIVDLRTRSPASFEALMRWNHPVRGLVPPSEFIPIAERTGLIADLGDWAIHQACRDASGWPAGPSVAVNLSAVQFRDSDRLIRTVRRALAESRLAPDRLELEVTESLLIEDADASLAAVEALHRLGVRFSLDDFGIGYSSLAYLARYPFSKVKIDRSFALQVTQEGASRAIIEVVCQLAHRLSMRVVVEGIETEQQRLAVEALGAEEAQGYLFGRPAAKETLFAPQHAA